LLKKYFSLLWVFTDFSILLVAFCDNAATNSNSENARSRMVASLRGSVGAGTKEDESSTGRVWAAGFHHVTACSRVARALKLMNRLFLWFSNFFFRAAANRDTAVHLYMFLQYE
jgi:hypothetical protein